VANTKLTHKTFLSSLIIALTLSSMPLHAGKIKCWKNSDGVRECGNVVPPEYSQKGHDELNAQGVKIKHHERALNKDELAERKRIADEKKAAQLAREEQERKDMVLLNTFANEDEIVMVRNGKITSIRTEIRLTYKSLNKAKDRLRELRKKAANFERAGKPAPKQTALDIQQAQKQIDNYEQFIASKKGELNKINDQFETDMTRYKELRRPRRTSTTQK